VQRRDLTKLLAGVLGWCFVGSLHSEGKQLNLQDSNKGNDSSGNRVMEETLLAITPQDGGVHEHDWRMQGTLLLTNHSGTGPIPISICRLCGVLGSPSSARSSPT
jgi:hypothetical protein